jgi:methyl-accepting chemotaxis protein
MTIDDQVTVRDEVKRILNETQDAFREIEDGVDQINQLMVELLLSGALRELAQGIADDIGSSANALLKGLDQRVEEVRKEITATTGAEDNYDDDGEDGEAA